MTPDPDVVTRPEPPAPDARAAGAGRSTGGGRGRRTPGPRLRLGDRPNVAGWLFVAPTLVVLGLFLLVPILMALWVSVSDWTGRGSPFSGETGFVGLANYRELFAEDALTRQDFMTSLRNNFYFVLLVVPAQTVLALFLAVVLNQQLLRARGFFRSAFYFPSVTSSVAISLTFLFLFTGSGAVNRLLGLVGIDGPNWFSDARGLFHLAGDALGLWEMGSPPAALTGDGVLSLTWWDWLSGPSVALCVIIMLVVWTTSGTFMLMFLAALQDVPQDVVEASKMDGANRWHTFRAVTLPHLRPTLLLVITLGLIGTWQVFDQVFVMTTGGPSKTTSTPAYLQYFYAFEGQEWGVAAAMAFVLFAIIFVLTGLQRFIFRDKDAIAERRAARTRDRRRRRELAAHGGDVR